MATQGHVPPSEQPLLSSIVGTLADPSALAVLLATLFGFVLPMLWIYPPVAPRPSDFLNETHAQLGLHVDKLDGEDENKRDFRGRPRRVSRTVANRDNTSGAPPGCIGGLWVYPIKSCAGIPVARSRVLPSGLEFDRLFTFGQLRSPFPARAGAVVGGDVGGSEEEDDASTWDAITQRQFPMLASLQVELWRPDLAKVRRAQANMRADDRAERSASMGELYVVVRYPWQAAGWAGRWDWFAAKLLRGWRAEPEVEVVLPVAVDKKAGAKHGRVQLSTGCVRALDLSAELPRSLQLYLGVSNRLGLLRFDPEDAHTDLKPVYLVNKSSQGSEKADKKDKTDDEAFEAENRLRANVVVDGVDANDEHGWERVSFRPPPVSQSLLDEAPFQVIREKAVEGIQMTPIFDDLDRPDLMELTLEAGMSVHVLQRRP